MVKHFGTLYISVLYICKATKTLIRLQENALKHVAKGGPLRIHAQ